MSVVPALFVEKVLFSLELPLPLVSGHLTINMTVFLASEFWSVGLYISYCAIATLSW